MLMVKKKGDGGGFEFYISQRENIFPTPISRYI
jgi:hypothetical protein